MSERPLDDVASSHLSLGVDRCFFFNGKEYVQVDADDPKNPCKAGRRE
jgi:hypothetical protein